MRTASSDIRAYDAYCDSLSSEPSQDEEIEALLAQAIEDEDFELVEHCETVLKQIVQPNLKQQALDSIVKILSTRSCPHDLVEVLSRDCRTLENAVRRCARCGVTL